ncbi:MAG: glycosyltransferase, partial [Kordiimonadaceae bacterium]|nr:glycosyltransferase [Kordiimonadaceae bacterium]
MAPKINVVDEFRALINLTIEPEVIDSFSQDIIQIPQESEVGELTSVDESHPEIVENQDVEVLNKYTYKEPVLTSEIKQEISAFDIKPLISIIMPVYNVDPKWLDLAINSIKNQWYQNWELCIADDRSDNQKTLDYLNSIDKENINIHFLNKNQNISVASNKALALA